MDILNSKIKPLYFKYLAAASGSALVASVFGLVDAMMVGQYHGPAGNAALAVFNPLWSIIFCLGLLAGIGGSVLFAANRGNGDEKNAQEFFSASVIFGAALSAAAMLIIGLFNEPLFRFFGADDELLLLAQKYLTCIFFAIPCCIFSNILSAYLRNDSNPSLATKAVIIGGVFNAVGDYLCIFVLDFGIFGAGFATALGQYISIAVMLSHFFKKRNTLRFVRPKHLLKRIGNISVIGFSTAINDLAMGIIGIMFNRQIMSYFDSDALAVYGIITQITAFAQCLSYGCGQAAQPIISQNYGANRFSRIKECLKYGLYSCAGMGLFWTLIMTSAPLLIVNMFMDPTPSVTEIAPKIICTYCLSYTLLPFNVFASDYYQAVLKPRLSLAASTARGIVVSGILIMLLPVIFGAESLWYAMLITEIVLAIFNAFNVIRCTKSLPR